MKKVGVKVESEKFSKGGFLKPLAIIWPDGRKFEIDEILHISTAPDNEFEGIRYTVIIGSAEKNIYYINGEWFVLT